jgi:hypothetical protein
MSPAPDQNNRRTGGSAVFCQQRQVGLITSRTRSREPARNVRDARLGFTSSQQVAEIINSQIPLTRRAAWGGLHAEDRRIRVAEFSHLSCSGAARSLGRTGDELYGTFESMGVIVSPRGGTPTRTRADLSYRVAGSGDYRHGFPLSRVAAPLVGSLSACRAPPCVADPLRPGRRVVDGPSRATPRRPRRVSVPSLGLTTSVPPTGTACTVLPRAR